MQNMKSSGTERWGEFLLLHPAIVQWRILKHVSHTCWEQVEYMHSFGTQAFDFIQLTSVKNIRNLYLLLDTISEIKVGVKNA